MKAPVHRCAPIPADVLARAILVARGLLVDGGLVTMHGQRTTITDAGRSALAAKVAA